MRCCRSVTVNVQLDQAIAALASTQWDLITTSQLTSLGVSGRGIASRVRRAFLRRVAPGVYALPGAATGWHLRAATACVACGPYGVLSHGAAARLWGLDLPRSGRIEITVPHGHSARKGLVNTRVHHSRQLAPAHRTRHAGFLVTTPERTLVDVHLAHVESYVAAYFLPPSPRISNPRDHSCRVSGRHAHRPRHMACSHSQSLTGTQVIVL